MNSKTAAALKTAISGLRKWQERVFHGKKAEASTPVPAPVEKPLHFGGVRMVAISNDEIHRRGIVINNDSLVTTEPAADGVIRLPEFFAVTLPTYTVTVPMPLAPSPIVHISGDRVPMSGYKAPDVFQPDPETGKLPEQSDVGAVVPRRTVMARPIQLLAVGDLGLHVRVVVHTDPDEEGHMPAYDYLFSRKFIKAISTLDREIYNDILGDCVCGLPEAKNPAQFEAVSGLVANLSTFSVSDLCANTREQLRPVGQDDAAPVPAETAETAVETESEGTP